MSNITYNVVTEGGSNESSDNVSSGQHRHVRPACSDVFPSTTVYFQDLQANYGEAILVGICCLLTLLLWIYYCIQLRSRDYKFKDVTKRFKTLCLLGIYPMTALMATFSLLVPRSTILVDLVASCYLSLCIYIFITLIFHYFGGKQQMIVEMEPYKVTTRTPPCCCCCCCLPDLKVTKVNVRKFEVLTMQIAIVVPFVLFVKAVLWTDDVSVLHGSFLIKRLLQYKTKHVSVILQENKDSTRAVIRPKLAGGFLHKVNPNNVLFYIVLATVVSTLLAMYGLVVTVKATELILKKHRIRLKFVVLQLVLIFTNLQSAIISIFYRFDLPPCRGTIGTKVRGSVIQHMLLVLEMFLLAILASVAYRRSEHRNLTETNLADVGGEPTFDCRKLGTVATSTGDLHKYMLDGPEAEVNPMYPNNGNFVVKDVSAVPRFTIE